MALAPAAAPPAGLPALQQPATRIPWSPAPQPPTPGQQSPLGTNNLNLSQILAGQTPSSTDPAAASLWSGIGQFELGPASQALGAQTSLLGTQNSLSQQQLADQAALERQSAGFSQAQLGIQGSNNALQQAALQAQAGPGGFQSQQRGLTAAEQAYQTGQQQRALRSSATASGAVNTSGTQQSWSDILAQQGFQQQQLGLQAKEQQQAYQTSQAQLNNAAKSLGISSQQVTAQLNNALNQLGLQGSLDSLGVMQGIQQLQAGFLSGPWATAIQQVLQAAGLPLSAFWSQGNPNVPSIAGGVGTPTNPALSLGRTQ